MNWRSLSRSMLLVVPILCLVSSCSGVSYMLSGSSKNAGFAKVDDLLTRVERVHVSCELAGQNVSESVSALMTMVGPEFKGDPTAAYGDLTAALERSRKQQKDLRQSHLRMQKSSKKFFDDWQRDLDAFTSEGLREHSAQRMAGARQRYEAIVRVVDPAIEQYEVFNASMLDHIRYIGNDFSSESVALIERELRALLKQSTRLTGVFEQCTAACQTYVHKAALRGQVSPKAHKEV